MGRKIGELAVGEVFNGFLLVKEVTKSTAKNGTDYLRVVVGDSTGDLVVMVWDADDNKEKTFSNGNIVYIEGEISEYNGTRQLNVNRYRTKTEEDSIEIADLLEAAPIKGHVLFKSVVERVYEMKNEVIKNIVIHLLKKYKKEFAVYPAAQGMHHNYVYGLVYHTWSMMKVAEKISDTYNTVDEGLINTDLLVAGVIIHDIGKVKELTGYIGTEYTLEGKLKGHITIINEEIRDVATELGYQETEELLLLQHMVLSHHGKLEWGTPVVPKIIEARILHQIDMIDAGVDMYRKAVRDVEEGTFTDKIYGLDNQSYYKHNLD